MGVYLADGLKVLLEVRIEFSEQEQASEMLIILCCELVGSMDEDEIVSAEEDVFYDYTIPADLGPNDSDAALNGTTEFPEDLSSDVTAPLTGDGATSTLASIVDYLNSTLGIDLVSRQR
jgi:hypothetical protein